MPIYEYRRPDGSTFEVVQSFSDESLTHDPETGVEVQRVLHPPAVHFKGKGFYNTDYGTRKRQRESAAESSSSESSDSAKSEKGSGDDAKKPDGKSSDGKGSGGKSVDGKGKGSSNGSAGAKRSDTVSAKS